MSFTSGTSADNQLVCLTLLTPPRNCRLINRRIYSIKGKLQILKKSTIVLRGKVASWSDADTRYVAIRIHVETASKRP